MMGDYLFNDDVMVDMIVRLFAPGVAEVGACACGGGFGGW